MQPSAELSVVVPMHNEAENAAPLVREIRAALGGVVPFEIVCVDDGSADDTPRRLAEVMPEAPELRVVRHARRSGQSAALVTGVRAARAPLVATLDGDGQNDPADIPALLDVMRQQTAGTPVIVCGWRTTRRDTLKKRISSKLANAIRGGLLHDRTPDTGCGLKLFARDTFLALPPFDHMHRFLPALVIREGGRAVSVPVRHRPRARGRSHYGMLDRAWVGIWDLMGVMWLTKRPTAVEATEVVR